MRHLYFTKCAYLAYNLSKSKFPATLKQISLIISPIRQAPLQSFQLSRHFQNQVSEISYFATICSLISLLADKSLPRFTFIHLVSQYVRQQILYRLCQKTGFHFLFVCLFFGTLLIVRLGAKSVSRKSRRGKLELPK